jgi:hypothetical protein
VKLRILNLCLQKLIKYDQLVYDIFDRHNNNYLFEGLSINYLPENLQIIEYFKVSDMMF